ncbi:MAG: hypothetical protein JSS09_06215 [Verrucomicrobia bacterium]|nr:hypothetical protein [Verrucomicrobiota bacterium]
MNISLHALASHPTQSVYYKAEARIQDDENDPQNVKEITDISLPSNGGGGEIFYYF